MIMQLHRKKLVFKEPAHHKFKQGTSVKIQGTIVTLELMLHDVVGGWRVSPAVNNIRFWNEDAMTEVEA